MFIRNINKFSSILHPSSRLSNRFYNFFAKGNRESPTKILLLAGEGIHENIWLKTTNALSELGYTGKAISLNLNFSTSDEAVAILKQELDSLGVKPLLITHSLGSLLAQKYLESYALKGLISLDPIEPTISSIPHLYHRLLSSTINEIKNKKENKLTNQEVNNILSYYFFNNKNINKNLIINEKNTINNLLKLYSIILNNKQDWIVQLEPQSVPMIFLYSSSNLIINSNYKQEIQSYYQLYDDEIVQVGVNKEDIEDIQILQKDNEEIQEDLENIQYNIEELNLKLKELENLNKINKIEKNDDNIIKNRLLLQYNSLSLNNLLLEAVDIMS